LRLRFCLDAGSNACSQRDLQDPGQLPAAVV
jgi:hypothetical protein